MAVKVSKGQSAMALHQKYMSKGAKFVWKVSKWCNVMPLY